MQPMGSSMLRWLPKKLSKHDYYFVQLLGVVCAAHVLLFLTLLYWASRGTLVVDVSGALVREDMPIIIVPYMKRTGQLELLARGLLKPSRKRGRVKQEKKVVYKQVVVARKASPVRKKRIVLPAQTKPKIKVAKKSLAALKKEKKAKLKHEAHIKNGNIDRVKEPEKLPAIVPETPMVKPAPAPVTPMEPAKPPSEPVLEPVSDAQSPIVEPLDITFGANQEAATGDEAGTGPLVLGQQEVEQLQRYQEVQERISPHWRPPLGIRVVQACVLLVTINALGAVEQMVVEQSSGVLAYDMAARMAVYRAQFPDSVKNQQVRLHF